MQCGKAQEGGTQEEQMKEGVVQEVVFQAAHPVMQETAPKTDVEESPHKKLKSTMVAVSAGIAFIIVIIGIIAFNVYNGPRNKLKRALASENLIEAEHIYSDNHLSEDWRAHDVLFAFVDKEIEMFDLGEKDYDSVFRILSNINSNFEYMDIENKLCMLADIKMSKENFALAEKEEQANNLAAAIIYYDSVGYSLYDKASSKVAELTEIYKVEIIEKANALTQKEDYRAAAELLDHSLEVLTADSEIISLRDDNQAKAVSKVLSNAETSAAEENYAEAIEILKTCSLESEEIESRLAEITKIYEKKVLADAEALANEGKYEEAVSAINQAIPTLGEKTSFTQKIEEYKAKFPVSLLNFSPSAGEDYSTISSHYDIYGNVSGKSLYFAMSNDNVWSKSKQVKYAVSGKYKGFGGRILVDANDSVGTAKCSIAIYADNVLKYSNDSLTKESEPIDIDIDIENTKFLKIVVEYISGGGDYKIDYGPTLYKTNVSLIIDSPILHN